MEDAGDFTSETGAQARMEHMRFQAFENVDLETLGSYAEQFRSPRLMAAMQVWSTFSKQSLEEGVEL